MRIRNLFPLLALALAACGAGITSADSTPATSFAFETSGAFALKSTGTTAIHYIYPDSYQYFNVELLAGADSSHPTAAVYLARPGGSPPVGTYPTDNANGFHLWYNAHQPAPIGEYNGESIAGGSVTITENTGGIVRGTFSTPIADNYGNRRLTVSGSFVSKLVTP